jgi:hypothetical protein
MSDKVEPEAAAPFAIAIVVAVFARAAGADWTELAGIAAVKTAAGKAMPRLVKNSRSFSTARNPHLRGVFTCSQSSSDFSHTLAVKKTQHDRVAVRLA